MFNRVLPNLLTPRLDADFYKKDFILNEAHLRKFGVKRLAKLINVKGSGYGVLPSSNEYCDDGIPLIRGGDLSFGEIVSPSVFAPMSYKDGKGTAQAGDVLILIKGACIDGPEGVARVKQENHGHLFNGSCFRLAFDNREIDGPFFIAYSQSKFFLKQKKRQVANTGISYNDEDSIHGYLIPGLEDSVKKHIGDKVRQAEKLRAWAKVLYRIPAFIDALIQGVLPLPLTNALTTLLVGDKKEATKELTKFLSLNIADPDTKQVFQSFIAKNKMGSVDTEREFFHINTVATDAIEDFLSAQTYRPAITEAFDIITSTKHTSLQAMSLEPIRQGATPKFSTIGKKCIKSKQTRDLFLDETGYETVDPDDEQNKRVVRLKRNDILITRQGAGTVGRASIFLDDEETYITDSLFLVRIDSDKAHPAFIAGFLRSYTGQRLIEKGVYGSTGQLNLSSGALRNIPVPDVDLDFQNFLGEALCTADTLFKLSTRLTQAAKTLVEVLIEGQLNEQQLIQAQQTLEDGDNTLDQAILSKLSSEGYAIEGATPLFSDLDELYRLLESAARAEVEE